LAATARLRPYGHWRARSASQRHSQHSLFPGRRNYHQNTNRVTGKRGEQVMKPEITVLICDDHPIFRHGLRQVVEADPRLTVVGEAEDGEISLLRIEQFAPQVAILDIDMPGKDGFEVARTIREKGLPVKVIILTMHKDERILNAALDLGVRGYVLKDSA